MSSRPMTRSTDSLTSPCRRSSWSVNRTSSSRSGCPGGCMPASPTRSGRRYPAATPACGNRPNRSTKPSPGLSLRTDLPMPFKPSVQLSHRIQEITMNESTPATGVSRRSLLRNAGILGLVMAGSPAFLAACQSGTTPATSTGGATTAAVKGGTLKAALTGEPDSLDPAVSSVYTGAQVYDNIFSKLVTIGADGKLVGRLASKWTATNSTTWTVDLVDNAFFHNGEKFTSADVTYTFERIANPKTASAYAPLFSAIKSIATPSPTQVVFTLSAPYAPFLTNLANNGEIVNQKAIESGDPSRKPIVTGPFQFVDSAQGDPLTLKKFDKDFEAGQPLLDEIDFKFLLVDQGRIDALS